MNKKIISAALAASLTIISATTATAFALNSKTVAKKTSVAPAVTQIYNDTAYLGTNHCTEMDKYFSTSTQVVAPQAKKTVKAAAKKTVSAQTPKETEPLSTNHCFCLYPY